MAFTRVSVNMMDKRAAFRMDIRLHVKMPLWALLQSLCQDPCSVGLLVIWTVARVALWYMHGEVLTQFH